MAKSTGTSVQDMYRKSILFEIVNLETNKTLESFTLTIPPDSIEITQPQRVKRTKTFGGVFEDDYGLDNGKITISGHTGGVDGRATYKVDDGVTGENYDGQKAIYHLFDNIIRYKEHKDVKGEYDKYEMRIYDLSCFLDRDWNLVNLGQVKKINISTAMGYVVSLDDFKISRNKDRPLFYNYSIELFIVAHLGKKRGRRRQPKLPNKNWLKTLLANLKHYMGLTKTILSNIKNMDKYIKDVESIIDSYTDQLNFYLTTIGDIYAGTPNLVKNTIQIAKYPFSFAKDLMKSVDTMINGFQEMTVNMPEVAEAAKDIYDETIETMNSIQSICSSLVVYGKTKEAQSPGIIDVTSSSPDGSPSNAAPPDDLGPVKLASTSSGNLNIGTQKEEEKEVIIIYGFRSLTVDSGTTLEKIAEDYYGDASMCRLISSFNGISGDDELQAGTTIKVPVLSELEADNDNLIFDLEGTDVYGKDIKLGEDGKLSIGESGDYMLVQGKNNLIQSLNMRLNEALGKRIRLNYYGLKVKVGSASTTNAPMVYLISNIKDTILQDPRIKSLDSLNLKGHKDSLSISFDLTTISDTKESFLGVF